MRFTLAPALAPPAPPGAAARRGLRSSDAHLAGVLLLVQHACMLATLGVLAVAIGWPASLGAPIADQLAALRAHAASVEVGYASYLVSSLALGGAALALRRALAGPAAAGALLLDVLAAAGVAAAFAKLLGIVRWFEAMPVLAGLHQGGAGGAAGVLPAATAIDAYAGSVGEVLGVGLLSSIFYAALALAIHRTAVPRRRALVAACAITGGLGLPWGLVLHIDLGPLVTIGGAFATIAGVGVAASLLRSPRGSLA